jgi:hypothetical protein
MKGKLTSFIIFLAINAHAKVTSNQYSKAEYVEAGVYSCAMGGALGYSYAKGYGDSIKEIFNDVNADGTIKSAIKICKGFKQEYETYYNKLKPDNIFTFQSNLCQIFFEIEYKNYFKEYAKEKINEKFLRKKSNSFCEIDGIGLAWGISQEDGMPVSQVIKLAFKKLKKGIKK